MILCHSVANTLTCHRFSRSQDNTKENNMKVLPYIAIYALLITLCSTKSNSSSNKTPGKKVFFK